MVDIPPSKIRQMSALFGVPSSYLIDDAVDGDAENNGAIGDRIRIRRLALGLTQQELAEKLGYKSKASIAKIESGVTDIAQTRLPDFASALHTTVPELLGWANKTDNTHTTGERVKTRRKELGISAERLSEQIGIHPATLYRYENGFIEKVPSDVLKAIADALHTTPEWLMGWSDTTQDERAALLKIAANHYWLCDYCKYRDDRECKDCASCKDGQNFIWNGEEVR